MIDFSQLKVLSIFNYMSVYLHMTISQGTFIMSSQELRNDQSINQYIYTMYTILLLNYSE